MMGTKKVGAFSSPRKKAMVIINPEKQIACFFYKKFLHAKKAAAGKFILDKVPHLFQTVAKVNGRTRWSGGNHNGF